MRAAPSLAISMLLALASGLGACSSDDSGYASDGPRAGCADGDVLEQRHGTACLCCHESEFSVAGSVNREGPLVARVVVTDRDGLSVDTVPNAFGNFFRHLKLKPPLEAIVFASDGRELRMKQTAPSGDCNACHRVGGAVAPIQGPP